MVGDSFMGKILLRIRKSTKFKILSICVSSLLLLYVIIWVILYHNLLQPLSEERNQYVAMYAQQVTSGVISQKQIYEKMILNLGYNYSLVKDLSQSESTPLAIWESMTNIKRQFRSNMAIMPSIKSMSVYARGGNLWTDGMYIFTEEFDDNYMLTDIRWVNEYQEDVHYISNYHMVQGLSEPLKAYIKVAVNGQKAFGDYMHLEDAEEMRSYLTNKDGFIIASSIPKAEGKNLNDMESGMPEDLITDEIFKVDGDIAIRYAVDDEWYVVAILSSVYTEGKMFDTYLVIGGAMIGIAMVTGSLLWVFLSSILNRINMLADRMKRIWDEKELVEISSECDEVRRLELQYNLMIRRLDKTVEEMAQVRTQKQQFEIRSLESQINPHFLYNTLGAMRWNALDSKNEKLVSMIDNLASFYRRSQDRGKGFFTIKQEIELIESYTAIQQERCDHCVNVVIDVDTDTEEVKIPKMILQPLIENIWLHGDITLPGNRSIEIVVKRVEKGRIQVIVSDNGSGISHERLEQISHGNIEEGRGIGVAYIKDILKFYYGNSYVYEIESTEGTGTKILMIIPDRMEKNQINESNSN